MNIASARAAFLGMFLTAQAVTAVEDGDWPCFHGSDRSNRSSDNALMTIWPDEGPALLWAATNIGHGYSSVAIAGERIFTAGTIGKDTHVTALSLDGKKLWQGLAGESWQASERQQWAVPYSGSRATPTVDGDTVYFLSEMGRLNAFDASNGNVRWTVDVARTFEAERPKYGYSESVLVHGDKLFCCPAGRKGYMAAFDKSNGALVWTNTEIDDPVGYSSSVPARIGEKLQIVSLTSSRVFAVNPDDGKLLWQYLFGNKRSNNATDVIVHDGLVYVSSGYGRGSALLRPARAEDGAFVVESVWESELLDNHHGGVVLVDGYLYGAGHQSEGWFCLSIKDGRKCWHKEGKGSLTYAEGHLYCLDEKGEMSLVRADPGKYAATSSFEVPRGGRGAYWAHPVVCHGRLHVRHSDKLYAYDIRKR